MDIALPQCLASQLVCSFSPVAVFWNDFSAMILRSSWRRIAAWKSFFEMSIPRLYSMVDSVLFMCYFCFGLTHQK